MPGNSCCYHRGSDLGCRVMMPVLAVVLVIAGAGADASLAQEDPAAGMVALRGHVVEDGASAEGTKCDLFVSDKDGSELAMMTSDDRGEFATMVRVKKGDEICIHPRIPPPLGRQKSEYLGYTRCKYVPGENVLVRVRKYEVSKGVVRIAGADGKPLGGVPTRVAVRIPYGEGPKAPVVQQEFDGQTDEDGLAQVPYLKGAAGKFTVAVDRLGADGTIYRGSRTFEAADLATVDHPPALRVDVISPSLVISARVMKGGREEPFVPGDPNLTLVLSGRHDLVLIRKGGAFFYNVPPGDYVVAFARGKEDFVISPDTCRVTVDAGKTKTHVVHVECR